MDKCLSKNLLEMKFMQRTKERIEIVKKDKETKDLEEKFLPPSSNDKKLKLVVEPRLTVLEDYLECGRLSFKGFNPEVEKCMAHYQCLRQEGKDKLEREHQGQDVNDKEMASRYVYLSNTLAKKFKTKRQRRDLQNDEDDDVVEEFRPKKKFRKPKD